MSSSSRTLPAPKGHVPSPCPFQEPCHLSCLLPLVLPTLSTEASSSQGTVLIEQERVGSSQSHHSEHQGQYFLNSKVLPLPYPSLTPMPLHAHRSFSHAIGDAEQILQATHRGDDHDESPASWDHHPCSIHRAQVVASGRWTEKAQCKCSPEATAPSSMQRPLLTALRWTCLGRQHRQGEGRVLGLQIRGIEYLRTHADGKMGNMKHPLIHLCENAV